MAVFTTTADAVDREAAWLSTAGDGLPNLLAEAGGRFDIVNPYWARTPGQRKRVIWVNRARFAIQREAHVRKMVTYHFELEVWWPLAIQTGSSETEQRAFDVALNDLAMRISGFGYNGSQQADKTHGGRFLSVGETLYGGDIIDFNTTTTTQALPVGVGFKSIVTYAADDFEFNN